MYFFIFLYNRELLKNPFSIILTRNPNRFPRSNPSPNRGVDDNNFDQNGDTVDKNYDEDIGDNDVAGRALHCLEKINGLCVVEGESIYDQGEEWGWC